MKRTYLGIIITLLIVFILGCTESAPAASPVPDQTPVPFLPEETSDDYTDGENYTVIAKDFLTLRDAPDSNAQALALIPAGEIVTVFLFEGDFAYVETQSGRRGYVLAEFLSNARIPEQMRAGDIYSAYVNEFLSLRVSADTCAERIEKLPADTLMRILDADADFARVEVPSMGLRGYVLCDYLIYAEQQQELDALEPKTGLHTVICREFVTLRTAPDVDAAAAAKLDSGTRVEVLDYEDVFARVRAGAQTGYVLANYLTPGVDDKTPDTPVYMYVMCEEFLSLRSEPDTASSRIDRLSCGTRVRVIGYSDAFAHVETDAGQTGYVLLAYLSETQIPTESPLSPKAGAYRVVCEKFVTLRVLPSARAEELARLKKGTQVELLGFDGRFAKINASGITGYVIAGYLKGPDIGLDIVQEHNNYTYKMMMADLNELVKMHDNLTLEIVGKSVEGRDIPVVRIGSENARYHILTHGGIHAREHMTSLLLAAQIEYTISNTAYAGVSSKRLLDNVCIHVLPMINPDGITISQNAKPTDALTAFYAADTDAGLTALPIEEYLQRWKANAAGVDLNRNFDAGWDTIDSPNGPSATHYKGAAPADQPETQALVSYTKRFRFDATLSYHAFGSIIYWEYGDDAHVNALSKDLGFAIRACTQYPLPGSTGTDAGGYKDWAMQKLGIPSVTIEIGTRACPLPPEEFSNVWARNKNALLAAARWVKR